MLLCAKTMSLPILVCESRPRSCLSFISALQPLAHGIRRFKLPKIMLVLLHSSIIRWAIKCNAHRLLCIAAAKPTNIQKGRSPVNSSSLYRPYSKLGTMTGPYFIGAPYPPSFCTMKSTAKLSFPLPCPGTACPKVPLTISGSYMTHAT